MSCRILQSNHLYRRIEHRNIFQTFSKSYKKRSLNRFQENRTMTNNPIESTSISINQTLDNFVQSKLPRSRNEKSTIKSERNESEAAFPAHLHQKYSAKLLTSPLQTHAKTTPIDTQMRNLQNQRKFSRDCLTSLSSKNQTSEAILIKWNQRRKNEDFKLKSCLDKDKANYEYPFDETDFSTLQLKKRSEVLSRRDERYNQKWRVGAQRENKALQSQTQSNFENSRKGAYKLSKYSKFMEEGLRSNLQLFTMSRK